MGIRNGFHLLCLSRPSDIWNLLRPVERFSILVIRHFQLGSSCPVAHSFAHGGNRFFIRFNVSFDCEFPEGGCFSDNGKEHFVRSRENGRPSD